MGKKYFIGIDSGTQSTRVIIFDEQGKQICKGVGKHPPLIHDQLNWAEHGEYDAWYGLCEATRSALDQFQGERKDIVAIGLSSQRGTVMAVDREGHPLQRPISWMDARMAMEMSPMPEDCDPWYKFCRFYSKANWCKVHRPEAFEAAYKWLTIGGYLGYRLCGVYKDTISNQTGAWPVDRENWCLEKEDWPYECVGIRRDQMAEMVFPGELLGKVTTDGAKLTGFPEGCPVYACMGDKQCEALGAGVIHPGQSYITLGTSVQLSLVGDKMLSSPNRNFLTYLCYQPKIYQYEASLVKGYWLVSWFREQLAKDLEGGAKAIDTNVEALLDMEAQKVPAGSAGLITVPDWQGPRNRANAKGVMLGFDERHGRAHMFRSLVEGISMALKVTTDVMCDEIGTPITSLRIGGGGSRSQVAMQSTADIFNIPTVRVHTSETCSLGAAICAAVGSGAYSGFQEAVDRMVGDNITDIFQPDPENHQLYEGLMDKVYRKIYPMMSPVFDDLLALTKDHK